MAQSDETGGGCAVMFSPRDQYWSWSVYDLDGRSRATGQDADRDVAWRSALLAAGAMRMRRPARQTARTPQNNAL